MGRIRSGLRSLLRRKDPDPSRDAVTRIPVHLAVIMDGNGRWAKQRSLPRKAGHRAGAENLRRLVDACARAGVRYLTVFAFSTENWNRSADEVASLMDLFVEFFERFDPELADAGVRVRFCGDLDALPQRILEVIRTSERTSRGRNGMQLVVAFNYGSRRELAHAAREIARDVAEGRLRPDEVDEGTLSGHLYLPDVPDPDLLIRPSGEYRLSNFLLWQAAYSELWFSDVLWPDFSERDLQEAFASYSKRNRRFGGAES